MLFLFISENDRISMKTTPDNTSLCIKTSTRLDSGLYTLTLENSAGTNSYKVEVVVLGTCCVFCLNEKLKKNYKITAVCFVREARQVISLI